MQQRVFFFVLLACALQLLAGCHAQSCHNMYISGSTIDPNLLACTEANNVLITSTTLTVVALPSLKRIADSLIIQNSGVSQVSLPELTEISHDLRITGNAQLQSVELNKLKTVYGLEYSNNYQSYVSLPLEHAHSIRIEEGVVGVNLIALQSVTADVVIQSSTLQYADLRVLATVSGLRIAGSAVMEIVWLPNLETVGTVSLESNAHLSRVALNKLTTVTSLQIQNNPYCHLVQLHALQTLSYPQLQPIQNLESCQPILVANFNAICQVWSQSAEAHLEQQVPAQFAASRARALFNQLKALHRG